jgi:phosphoribosyl-AMP cyclohydrolase
MIEISYTDGLVPVVAQDAKTGEVLMVAYASPEAVDLSLETGFAHYFSRSRGKIWKKGEESGNLQKVSRILVDCDQDCLLYEIEQVGGAACHTGHRSCFYRTIQGEELSKPVFDPGRVYRRT